MARAKLLYTVQDSAGNILTAASATVAVPNSATPISETLYADKTGGTTVSNPISANVHGEILAYLDVPRMVDLIITAPGYSTYTVPDVATEVDASDVVTLTTTQTLTNKTLTSPTLNSATLSTPAITGGTAVNQAITGATVVDGSLSGTSIGLAEIAGMTSVMDGTSIADILDAGYVNLRWLGATGDGSGDDGVVLQSALTYCRSAGRSLFIPWGTYRIDTQVTLSNMVGVNIIGEGMGKTTLTSNTAGYLLTLTCPNRSIISNIAFANTAGGSTAVNGVLIQSDASGTLDPGGQVLVEQCQFADFAGRGLYINGVNATEAQSGNEVNNCIFLSNGITSGTAQFTANYSHDGHIEKNEFGVRSLAGPFPLIGFEALNCSAGNFTNNYHWANYQGAQYTGCSQARWIGNRWETNLHEGAKWSGCGRGTWAGNTIHTNNMASTTPAYNGIELYDCDGATLTANSFQTWDTTTGGSGYRVLNQILIDATCSPAPMLVGNEFHAESYSGSAWSGTAGYHSNNTGGAILAGVVTSAGFVAAAGASVQLNSPDNGSSSILVQTNADELLFTTDGDTTDDASRLATLNGTGHASIGVFRPKNGIQIGTSSAPIVSKILQYTSAWDPANLAHGTSIVRTITDFTGLAKGDPLFIGFATEIGIGSAVSGIHITAYATDTDEVTLTLSNFSGVDRNLDSNTLTVVAFHFA